MFTSTDGEIAEVVALAQSIRSTVGQVIEGKPEAVDLAITALLAESHLLIEDVPGVGKTMLAKSLARAIDCTVRRIQFTPDLLPSDITGVSVWSAGAFEFKPGGVFANIVIGDEINRASPKTQSALLRRWRNDVCRWTPPRTARRAPSWSLPLRTRSIQAPTLCRKRNGTVSACASRWVTRATKPRWRCSITTVRAILSNRWCRSPTQRR